MFQSLGNNCLVCKITDDADDAAAVVVAADDDDNDCDNDNDQDNDEDGRSKITVLGAELLVRGSEAILQ